MSRKDLHDEPFDENTIAKLEIFEDYAQAWLPTFIMQRCSEVSIFDFFAGTGYDRRGVEGSPIRILQKIKEQIENITKQSTRIYVYLNEFDERKFNQLKQACNHYLNDNADIKPFVEISYYNEDFETLFPKLLPVIKRFPALVYLDQNGIKFLSDRYFLELEKTTQTDFLYFLSASYFWRFGNIDEFRIHLNIDIEEIKKDRYELVRRNIIKQLKNKLPAQSKLRLYPFSIKKRANIYGIIFGASHPRAVDKFLTIAWKRNEINGEANFDIDGDSLKSQGLLFEKPRLTKIELFAKNVAEKVLSEEIQNNSQLYNYALEEGHLGRHAADVLRNLKTQRKIHFDGTSPLVTYDNVWAIDIQRQCDEQRVSFFFKQWGTWGEDGQKRNKKANGRILLGKEWNNKPNDPTIYAF